MSLKKELLDDLHRRRAEAQLGGGQVKIEERHKRGLYTARERLTQLFAPGTFVEMGMHVQHACQELEAAEKRMPGDGVITGVGHIDGRPVAAFSQDFTVGGGALGRMHAHKLTELLSYALRVGIPVVGINDSGGARIQEGVDALSGYGQVFYRNVLLSGVVPQIAVIAGSCAGGAAYSPALMDIIIMTKRHGSICSYGPEVIKALTGAATTLEEVGSAEMHASVSGNIHFVADDDAHALSIVRRLLTYLPANNRLDPPHAPTAAVDATPDLEMNALIPDDPNDAIDAAAVIARLTDGGELLELQRDYARNIICGFARIEGIVVGIVANQPLVKGGALDIDASDKGARFIRLCNVFNIPLVSLVDVPGFMPSVREERAGLIRHCAKMLFAWAAATVPKVTLIMRKAYGGAYLAMGSKDMGADMVFAWPCAELAVMGAEAAANVIYRDEIARAADREQKLAELTDGYRNKFASPWQAAAKGMLTDVIEPSESRRAIAMALRTTLTKREARPAKKHGNIAL